MNTPFGKTFMFLTKLAWNSRVTLPMIVTAAFMAMDFRMQVEINVHTEGIMYPEDERNQIDDLTFSDSDSWETINSDDDEDDDEDDDYAFDVEVDTYESHR